MRQFAYSRSWLNLYVYKRSFFGILGHKSKAIEDKFFFHAKGREDPFLELKAAINAFNSNEKKWGQEGKLSRCSFPARYKVLKKKWPHLFKGEYECPDLKEWKDRIGGSRVSIVYTGAYPNNPASVFGHTLLRFHSKRKSALLDYTLGFRANVDTTDNAFTYTVKGLSGGYPGFYELKPYYVNIGIYNNSESRDIWEYDLNLTKEESDLLLKHIWEVSLNTGFWYYFLDENCSYYLLTLLETVRPSQNYLEKLDLFVHPIETVKQVVAENQDYLFRPSIKLLMRKRYEKLSKNQKELYKRMVENPKISSRDPAILDAVIEYWKFKNYKEKLKLSEEEKKAYKEVTLKRSELDVKTRPPKINGHISPIKVHDPSKILVSAGEDDDGSFFKFFYNWGYHGLEDNESGLTRRSFIDYVGAELIYKKEKTKLNKLNIISITSLEEFDTQFFDFSWRGKLDFKRETFVSESDLKMTPQAGLGVSKIFERGFFWGFLTGNGVIDEKQQLFLPGLEFGSKVYNEKFLGLLQYEAAYKSDKIISLLSGLFSYTFMNDTDIFFKAVFHDRNDDFLNEIGLKWHF